MHIAAHDRLALESDLRRAIARNELFLVYQPILDLETGTVPAAEALLRWQHATRGLVPPTEFIALAEESGVIVDIGAWVLETACEQAAQWAADGNPISISVNVSARQLDDPQPAAHRRPRAAPAPALTPTRSCSRSPRPR